MKFLEFSKYLQKLENTSKRLEITDILAELIKNLDENEAENAINLALGQLKAPFSSKVFNIADKMMIKVLETAYSQNSKEINTIYKDEGDLGNVAEIIANKTNSQKNSEKLNINEVYTILEEIADFQGSGSQDKKVSKLADLLTKVDSLSAKYIVRIVLGTTRLGFTALTIIDALSMLLSNDKSLRKPIEAKYNVYPNIALITAKTREQDNFIELASSEEKKISPETALKGISDIKMTTGVPLMPQLPQRSSDPEETMEKMEGDSWAEFKLDGTRVQLHFDRTKSASKNSTKSAEKVEQTGMFTEQPKFFVKTFTRNLDDSTHQFPDIIEQADKYINADSVVFDGEAIGYNKETGEYLPFQETIQRKRKHGVKDIAKEIPLKYLIFDILYLNGEQLLDKTLEERRHSLEKIIKPNETLVINKALRTSDATELGEYFKTAKDKNLEGLVVKNPKTSYQAGARSYAWIKLKRLETDESKVDDTIDATVLGYYNGKGVRATFGIGGFLVATYDSKDNKFKTISKIGTGLTDEDWVYLKEQCDKIKVKEMPKNVEVPKELNCDVWVNPQIVVEVRADEISKSSQHTAGYALRFPRLMRFRDDKNATDVTSIPELKQLFENQTS